MGLATSCRLRRATVRYGTSARIPAGNSLVWNRVIRMQGGDISNIIPDSYGWDAELLFKVKYPKILKAGILLKSSKIQNLAVTLNERAATEFNKELSTGRSIYAITADFDLYRYILSLQDYPAILRTELNIAIHGIKYMYSNNVRWLLEDPYRVRFVEPYKEKIEPNFGMKKILLSSIELLIKKGWVN
jgi:hypothetical protein